jgi:hypothetical protein
VIACHNAGKTLFGSVQLHWSMTSRPSLSASRLLHTTTNSPTLKLKSHLTYYIQVLAESWLNVPSVEQALT